MCRTRRCADEVAQNGILAYQADVTSFEQAKDLVKQVKEKFGRIDILVNNAGITRDKLLLRMSEKDWDDVIDTNLKGAFNLSKPAVAAMVSQRSGAILNITSISGIVGMPGQVNYSSSKAGMIGFTKALAKEVAKANITVNALALGFVETDMTAVLNEEYRKKALEHDSSRPLRPGGKHGGRRPVFAFRKGELHHGTSDSGRWRTGDLSAKFSFLEPYFVFPNSIFCWA